MGEYLAVHGLYEGWLDQHTLIAWLFDDTHEPCHMAPLPVFLAAFIVYLGLISNCKLFYSIENSFNGAFNVSSSLLWNVHSCTQLTLACSHQEICLAPSAVPAKANLVYSRVKFVLSCIETELTAQ